MKTTKIMTGWYRIYDTEGNSIGSCSNFQGFWKGDVRINGKVENAFITSNTKKGLLKKFEEKYSDLINVKEGE